MATVNLIMIGAGAVLLVLSVWRARGPYLRARALRAHEANLDRYESWRGGRPTLPERGPTSAELMGHELQRQVRLWMAVGGIGVLLIILGLALG